ncbi:hypothetical protein LSCM4_04254 [Leishmania orientalis]|uniref:Uncharacterized protein n=1 Tax=Leishmania orientalis TaxID=2249476 RepID=A0A836KM55_9TRYP|nr:hypothetical protein LSCM4_04254 [Leishmania orientalis]
MTVRTGMAFLQSRAHRGSSPREAPERVRLGEGETQGGQAAAQQARSGSCGVRPEQPRRTTACRSRASGRGCPARPSPMRVLGTVHTRWTRGIRYSGYRRVTGRCRCRVALVLGGSCSTRSAPDRLCGAAYTEHRLSPFPE